MVARRRKRPARERDDRIPSPPGYAAIPIKFSEKQQASHYLYVRAHDVRQGTKSTWPQKRTLFVLNVPPYCTEGFQVAYVVFQKPSGVSAALALKGPLLVSTESHPVKSGIHKWISDYADSMPDPEALRVEVDTFMEAHDQKIAEVEAPQGWPSTASPVWLWEGGAPEGGRWRPVLSHSPAWGAGEGKQAARKELLDFYAWQHRESKMEHLAQLRKKFEEDKQRIELLRAQRKFRPY
ncbi:ribosomal RNA-processing protein 7 homolog A [Papio anubis]|uniref:ribosomal RNA-processing protein 7 homolog A n=1 Tax=Papio anubis TaxID=9555 RepID=UPI0012AE292A|nr:ribosomal RNA-processing protein 7 homolog A [Papio anubis]